MNSIPHSQRFLPHTLDTRFHAVKLYRNGNSIKFICRRYKVSKSSLLRWNKRFDGTIESLSDRSHKPLTPHPNSHTEEEIKWIQDYHRRTPSISVCELYGKLRTEKGYSRHPGSLYRVFVRLGYRKRVRPTNKGRIPKPYDTPKDIGIKWQMDVKFVPTPCYSGTDGQKFYQYTVIDEASRERFIYPYMEHSSWSTKDFILRAIDYYGYIPKIIQTDNGSEFTHTQNTSRVHLMDILCEKLGVQHKLIRPRTPWHNGKVERSHRNDQNRFYNYLKFYSYDDLKLQMKRYLYRSNRIPMQILGWMSPLEKRSELENIRCNNMIP